MNTGRRVSDIELERHALDELQGPRSEEVAEGLKEGEGATRFEELQESNKEILDRYPPHMMAAQIKARAAEEVNMGTSSFIRRFLIPTVVAVSAAAVLWVFLPGTTEIERGDDKETILIKGSDDPTLFVYRKTGDKEEILRNGQVVKPGDVLQIKYAARSASFGVIFSIDGHGKTTLHYPSTKDGPSKLKQEGSHALPFSYELDDAPDFEHFYFITSDKPINIDELLDAAKKLETNHRCLLELKNVTAQHDLLLKKDSL
jgi:hypothetical protein